MDDDSGVWTVNDKAHPTHRTRHAAAAAKLRVDPPASAIVVVVMMMMMIWVFLCSVETFNYDIF